MLLGGLLSVAFAVPAQAAPTWLAPVDLSDGGQDASAPQVSVDSQGNATAIWSRYNGNDSVVQAATRAPGATWQTPITLSASGRSAYSPQVSVDAQGNATAIWYRSNGTNDVVQAATRAPGGAWMAAVNLSATGRNAAGPHLSVDTLGNATAIWRRSDGANSVVQAASRAPGGTWQTPIDLSASGRNAYEPQVSVDAQGNATAIWRR